MKIFSKRQFLTVITSLLFSFCYALSLDSTSLKLEKRIGGNISPKSIVHCNGMLFAQNMMYRHTITVYDTNGVLKKTINDTITPIHYGDSSKTSLCNGSPVEACSNTDGSYIWVSNYQMYGTGFDAPGCDACNSTNYDYSYLYGINTTSLRVEKVAKTGSVPKFLTISPNGLFLAVSNWSQGSVSIINEHDGTLITEIPVGRHPRGLAFNSSGTKLFIAIMGDDCIAEVDIESGEVIKHFDIADGPRHLLFSDDYLYISCNNEGKIKKWNTFDHSIKEVYVGSNPRSMSFSADSTYLYVVNYKSSTLSKVQTSNLKIAQTIKTDDKPIGVAVEPENNSVWVSCYSGSIQKFIEAKNNDTKKTNNTQNSIKETTSTNAPILTAETTDFTYHVIVGSFVSEEHTESTITKFKELGYSPYILHSPGRYRVSAFGCNDKETGLLKTFEITDLGYEAWLLKTK